MIAVEVKADIALCKVAEVLSAKIPSPDKNPVFSSRPKLLWGGWVVGFSKPRGVLPCMGYIRMCSPKGYGFSAVLVINRASII